MAVVVVRTLTHGYDLIRGHQVRILTNLKWENTQKEKKKLPAAHAAYESGSNQIQVEKHTKRKKRTFQQRTRFMTTIAKTFLGQGYRRGGCHDDVDTPAFHLQV